jgi:hypothetical protein
VIRFSSFSMLNHRHPFPAVLVSMVVSILVGSLQGSLISIYNFDAQNGNDSSGNNNHATGTVTYSTNTPFGAGSGYAFSVSGSSKLTAVHTTSTGSTTGFNDITSNLSISFWINSPSTGSDQWFRVMRKGAGAENSGHWIIGRYMTSSDLNIRVDTGPSVAPGGYNQNLAYNTANTILDSNWHLVTYTLSYSGGANGTYIEYLDGVQNQTGSFIYNLGFAPNTANLEIGFSSGNWTGLLDDIGIWSNALTAGEARSIYTLATSGFKYELTDVTQLHALHSAASGSVELNGYTWTYADNLAGSGYNPGDLFYNSSTNEWFLQMTSTTGLVATPEPGRALLALLATSLLLFRRRRASCGA